MWLSIVLQIWVTFQCLFYEYAVAEWSEWKENLLNTKWRRTNRCADSDVGCIREEETTTGCLEVCRNATITLLNPPGFSECDSVCSKGIHERSIPCKQESNCELVQKKRCYNTRICYGSWNSWESTDALVSCQEARSVEFVRYCIHSENQCNDNNERVRQIKEDVNPNCPVTPSSSRTTSRTTTTIQSRTCTAETCAGWSTWSSWSSCDAETSTQEEKRTCVKLEEGCTDDLEEIRTSKCESLQSQLILGFCIGISVLVLIGVAIIFVVKYRQVKHREKRAANANTNLLYRQTNLPSTHSSTLTLYNSQRNMPSVPGTTTLPTRFTNSAYSSPFDAVSKPEPQIRMTNDSIYATITTE